MKAKDQRLAELKSTVPEVTPKEALDLQRQGAALIDVREPQEAAQGSPGGAYRITRGFLELRVEDAIPNFDRTVILTCASGARSLFAGEALQRLGYRDVRSVKGGFNAWKDAGLPFEIPKMMDAAARERYSRHLLMPEVGEKGQLALLGGKVLVVGAGGLGSPAALYLSAAGVGTLGIVDHDVVDRSNLQRQVLHSDSRVGVPKVVSARIAIESLNPGVKVIAHDDYLDRKNVEAIFSAYDIIIDGSDNFATRY
ncbi:MAG: ThiF family adenylyltransferase, partial [Gammaproteobacteria bacterium]